MAQHRFVLGVERSATGRAWRDRLDGRAAVGALSIAQRHGLPELLARVIAGRGIEPGGVEAFLDPTVRRLMPDPEVLTDMERAGRRLADAVEHREPIAIFGDYDVDGATSAAVLATFLRHAGLEPFIHIPDRLFEGYGPNAEAVRSLAQRASLLVAVDCGTTSLEPIAEARRLGLDVIIIDHHQADERLPPAIVVNPNRLDDVSGLGHLAAVGLAFLAVVATNRELRRRGFWNSASGEPDLLSLLDLVALGTIADVVPLEGLNRAFVAKGVLVMRRRDRPGLTALMDVARLAGPPEPWHLGFLLGPRINAGGRVGRAELGTRLLIEQDPVHAAALAGELDRFNRDRQAIEQATMIEAEALAEVEIAAGRSVIVAAARDWHPGVLGLVSARLKEHWGRPAFAVALGPDAVATGSGRSITTIDLGRAVRRAVADGLLDKGGGHAMAAGITLRSERIPLLRDFLDRELGSAIEAARRDPALLIDGALTAAGAGTQLCDVIARAGPFGPGNPEPVFVLPSHTVAHTEAVGDHVRVRLKAGDGSSVGAIAFRAAGQPLGEALLRNTGRTVHAAGSLTADRWQGAVRPQFRLIDAAVEPM